MSLTRYLYHKTEVMHSLLFALLDRRREESLFWTYELYFSGFHYDLVAWLRWIYYTFYACQTTLYTKSFETTIAQIYRDDCACGTIVYNLVHRAYTIQPFTLAYLKIDIPIYPIQANNHRFLLRFRPCDMEQYQTVDICPDNARYYLREVSRFSVYKNESLFLQKYIDGHSSAGGSSGEGSSGEGSSAGGSSISADYDLHPSPENPATYLRNWLFYVADTPYWRTILEKYPSFQIDDDIQTATFTSDDELEAFYDTYGIEPDEQPNDVNLAHGVDVHMLGVFAPITPETFYSRYTTTN